MYLNYHIYLGNITILNSLIDVYFMKTQIAVKYTYSYSTVTSKLQIIPNIKKSHKSYYTLHTYLFQNQ